MVTPRFFEWFQFGALMCWALFGVTRAIQIHARGGRVFAADRERALSQKALDTLAFACLLVWAYEIAAFAWQFRFHIGPKYVRNVMVDSIAINALGAVVVFLATLLYAFALRHLGASWRLGIDRIAPGRLVTEGVYRWTRHPIYVAFDLLFVGTFLVLGRIVFLLLALVWIPMLHVFMLREERFLAQFHGTSYLDYRRRVGRYFSLPSQ